MQLSDELISRTEDMLMYLTNDTEIQKMKIKNYSKYIEMLCLRYPGLKDAGRQEEKPYGGLFEKIAKEGEKFEIWRLKKMLKDYKKVNGDPDKYYKASLKTSTEYTEEFVHPVLHK